MDRGEYLSAFDLASEALQVHPTARPLQHQMILALARAGATDQAIKALASTRLEECAGRDDPAMQEDVAALRARIAKDHALEASGPIRAIRAAAAAREYESIFRRLHRPYTCINAATMWLLAGDEARARDLAVVARDLCRATSPRADEDRYWQAATEAEAALHLGDTAGLLDALTRAARYGAGRLSSVAETRKQLLLISAQRGSHVAELDVLAIPTVIHYGGHRIAAPGHTGRFAAEAETSVAAAIRAQLDQEHVGFGYGSLAGGADILFAEALLARGAELHVLLPFAEDEFAAVSVEPSGDGWRRRFDDCLDRATSVVHTTHSQYLADDALFDYCARVAMGEALIRAAFLTAPVTQIAVWDGRPADGAAGTAIDVATWQRGGRVTHVIPVQGTGEDRRSSPRSRAQPTRALKAMLFGDMAGFSKLTDAQIPTFVSVVMGRISEVLDSFHGDILQRNTWGDGLYVVLSDVRAAATCSLALQAAIHDLDLPGLGLPPTLGLRIGAHVGPVFEDWDPVVKQRAFYGTEVTRTARIEPRTPGGEVYVTDAFAALLALDKEPTLSCEYVGHTPTAKDYGVFPMYVLKRHY